MILKNKTVTIIGASGFVGRYVVARLAREGAMIRAACRKDDLAGFLKTHGEPGQIVPIKTNLNHEGSVRRVIAGSDVVINLVGVLFEKGQQNFALHEQGAALVATVAAEEGVSRLVHMSALGADEESPAKYQKSKGLGEAAVLDAFPTASIMRPSVIFGAEDGFFNRFASLARMSPVLPAIDGGHCAFQPVFVGDVAEAVSAILADDDTAGRIFEFGGPQVMTLSEVYDYVKTVTGQSALVLPVPAAIASIKAFFFEFLPTPPLTRDQIVMMGSDNVCSGEYAGLSDLGIEPNAIQSIVPTYLRRYRRPGMDMAQA